MKCLLCGKDVTGMLRCTCGWTRVIAGGMADGVEGPSTYDLGPWWVMVTGAGGKSHWSAVPDGAVMVLDDVLVGGPGTGQDSPRIDDVVGGRVLGRVVG